VVAASLADLFDEIEIALRETRGGRDALARIEHTLTDGYASALALEGERWRIERRIGEVARDAAAHADELAKLAQRLSATDGELGRLRRRLAILREHAAAVRAA
jgi:chromosome segregation ATPase